MVKNAERDWILDMYKMMLMHYFKKGLGAKSELSNNTIITPLLVKTCLERYMELGGDENIMLGDDSYKNFLKEMKDAKC